MTPPEPMTPADADLQDFPFMPLHVARLRDSDLAAEAHPEACWYAVMLWAASWHQVPAGSLPDSDTVLARLCGLGRDLRTFKKHKADAMRGFVLCADGRLYHPVVAEQVREAWEKKRQQRWRSECARIKKHNQRHGTDLPLPTYEEFIGLPVPDVSPATDPDLSRRTTPLVPGDKGESPPGQTLQETGTGTGNKEEGFALVVGGAAATTPAVPRTRSRKSYPPAFEEVWAAYPHHEGRSSKPRSLDQWRALPEEERAALPGAIARFRPKVGSICADRGAPCMSRWLKDGKHLNFIAGNEAGDIPVEKWRLMVDLWRQGEAWPDHLGPAPDKPGTRVPRELLVGPAPNHLQGAA